jgi:hypothetical protein
MIIKSVVVRYTYRRAAPTFHSNIGTGLTDKECHTTGDFILKNWTLFTSRKWETGDCGILELFDTVIMNDARCTDEIKCRTVMAKVIFNRRRLFLAANWNSNLDNSYI